MENRVLRVEELMRGVENLRLHEFARRTGYEVSTIRKKVFKREIDSIKVGRIVLIPAREVDRLLADFRPRVEVKKPGARADGSAVIEL